MTTAKITRKEGFQCAPNGYTIETFACGAVVSGKVAEWALRQHAAARMFDPREDRKVVTEVETKEAPKKRGRPKKKAD